MNVAVVERLPTRPGRRPVSSPSRHLVHNVRGAARLIFVSAKRKAPRGAATDLRAYVLHLSPDAMYAVTTPAQRPPPPCMRTLMVVGNECGAFFFFLSCELAQLACVSCSRILLFWLGGGFDFFFWGAAFLAWCWFWVSEWVSEWVVA